MGKPWQEGMQEMLGGKGCRRCSVWGPAMLGAPARAWGVLTLAAIQASAGYVGAKCSTNKYLAGAGV